MIFLERTREVIINQMNTGTVSNATLGNLQRDGVESIRAVPSTLITS